MELMIVIVILGVLASFAIPNYIRTRQQALVKEAVASLRLMAAAEEIYRMENNTYAACTTGTALCNTNLRLRLPTLGNWAYTVNGVTATTFTARATKLQNPEVGCQYTLNQSGTTGQTCTFPWPPNS